MVTIVLGYLFPIAAQKEFVRSNSRVEAQMLCEAYIEELDHGENASWRVGSQDAEKQPEDIEKQPGNVMARSDSESK